MPRASNAWICPLRSALSSAFEIPPGFSISERNSEPPQAQSGSSENPPEHPASGPAASIDDRLTSIKSLKLALMSSEALEGIAHVNLKAAAMHICGEACIEGDGEARDIGGRWIPVSDAAGHAAIFIKNSSLPRALHTESHIISGHMLMLAKIKGELCCRRASLDDPRPSFAL